METPKGNRSPRKSIARTGRKKSCRKKKDPNAPKGPVGSYIFYQSEMRSHFIEENPDASMREITTMLVETWRSLTDEEKRPWVDMYKDDKLRYDREMKAYEEVKKNGTAGLAGNHPDAADAERPNAPTGDTTQTQSTHGTGLTVRHMSKDEIRELGEQRDDQGGYCVIQGLGHIVASELERRTKEQAKTIMDLRQKVDELETSKVQSEERLRSEKAVHEQQLLEARNEGLEALNQEKRKWAKEGCEQQPQEARIEVLKALKQEVKGSKISREVVVDETVDVPEENDELSLKQKVEMLRKQVEAQEKEGASREAYLQLLTSNNVNLRAENKRLEAELRSKEKKINAIKAGEEQMLKLHKREVNEHRKVADKMKHKVDELRGNLESQTSFNTALKRRSDKSREYVEAAQARVAFLEKKLQIKDGSQDSGSCSSSYSSLTKSFPQPVAAACSSFDSNSTMSSVLEPNEHIAGRAILDMGDQKCTAAIGQLSLSPVVSFEQGDSGMSAVFNTGRKGNTEPSGFMQGSLSASEAKSSSIYNNILVKTEPESAPIDSRAHRQQ